MTVVVIRPEARGNLRSITRYIARDNPDRADTFREELISHCRTLEDFPERGTPVPERGLGVRRLIHGNYLIFYRYDEARDRVLILAVTHSRRDLSKLRLRP